MNRATAMKEILDKRIASEISQISKNRLLGLLFMSGALLPLGFLVPCVVWIFPTSESAWVIVAVAAGCLSATLAIWNIGSYFTGLASSQTQRARQMEDLLLYFLSIPEEEWPAKEMLEVVITGRQPAFGPFTSVRAARAKEDDSKLE
jgi:hypothetical protein